MPPGPKGCAARPSRVTRRRLAPVPPGPLGAPGSTVGGDGPEGPAASLLRKEVIQPQVPLRLPCYDFIPITSHSVGGPLARTGFGNGRLS